MTERRAISVVQPSEEPKEEMYFVWTRWNGRLCGAIIAKDFLPKEGVLFKKRLVVGEDPELLSELQEKFKDEAVGLTEREVIESTIGTEVKGDEKG